jgi:hypothetical protein
MLAITAVPGVNVRSTCSDYVQKDKFQMTSPVSMNFPSHDAVKCETCVTYDHAVHGRGSLLGRTSFIMTRFDYFYHSLPLPQPVPEKFPFFGQYTPPQSPGFVTRRVLANCFHQRPMLL